jgi:hypothetical protein
VATRTQAAIDLRSQNGEPLAVVGSRQPNSPRHVLVRCGGGDQQSAKRCVIEPPDRLVERRILVTCRTRHRGRP